jgi:SPP1 family predicted phage head-tail adaptor
MPIAAFSGATMRTSQFDRHLRLEAPVESEAEDGGLAVSFIDKGRLWASIEATPGPEQPVADTLKSVQRLIVTMRRRGDIVRGMRLIEGRRIYRIVAVVAVGRRFLRAVCVEVSE